MKIVSGVCSVGAIVWVLRIIDDHRLLLAAVGVWAYPLSVIVDLYVNGGKAGAKLMDEVDELTTPDAIDRDTAREIVAILVQWLRHRASKFPLPNQNDNGFEKKFAKDVHFGLLRQSDFDERWTYDNTHIKDTDRPRTTQLCRDMIINEADHLEKLSAEASMPFSRKWKPDSKLSELSDGPVYDL